jgi:hypothetical protein
LEALVLAELGIVRLVPLDGVAFSLSSKMRNLGVALSGVRFGVLFGVEFANDSKAALDGVLTLLGKKL